MAATCQTELTLSSVANNKFIIVLLSVSLPIAYCHIF